MNLLWKGGYGHRIDADSHGTVVCIIYGSPLTMRNDRFFILIGSSFRQLFAAIHLQIYRLCGDNRNEDAEHDADEQRFDTYGLRYGFHFMVMICSGVGVAKFNLSFAIQAIRSGDLSRSSSIRSFFVTAIKSACWSAMSEISYPIRMHWTRYQVFTSNSAIKMDINIIQIPIVFNRWMCLGAFFFTSA